MTIYDIDSLVLLDKGYSKDKNNVYSHNEKIDWLDVNNFSIISDDYVKDDKNVFCYIEDLNKDFFWFKQIINADVDTFEFLIQWYSKDKNNVYFNWEIMTWANPKTFSINGFDEDYDEEILYDYNIGYSRDNKSIFIYWEKIDWVDLDSFEIIDSWYSKDKNNVYYRNNIIKLADLKSFESTWNRNAKDKNNDYSWGEIIIKNENNEEIIYNKNGYSIVKFKSDILKIFYDWNIICDKQFSQNKYYQNTQYYNDYIEDKEFISFLVYIDYYMSKSYWTWISIITDRTIWFDEPEKVLDVLVYILSNYEPYKNTYNFTDWIVFENKYHDKLVWKREAIVSSAIYHLLKLNNYLKWKYNYRKYYNLCLTYLDSNFKYLFNKYKEEWHWASYKKLQDEYILWEIMYDVPYRSEIYLWYENKQWTAFSTWWYSDCILK